MNGSYSNASASSSSSLNSSSHDAEDDQAIATMLAEDEKLKIDHRLGKRLSHLDSIPHTPRVNGEIIPDVNDATQDHERLLERLATYDLSELQIEGDGNCQFRALADQLFRNPDYHKHVRKQVVKQLKHHRKLYEAYVPMKYRHYLKKMKKAGEWGDHLTLQAAADRFGAKICVITSFRDACYIEILPKDRNPTRGKLGFSTRSMVIMSIFAWNYTFGLDLMQNLMSVSVEALHDKLNEVPLVFVSEVWLSFWSEVHYNSLYASAGGELNHYLLVLLICNIFSFLLDALVLVPFRDIIL